MKPIINQDFINQYSVLVTDNICNLHSVDPQDQRARAVLAWNLSNPDDPIDSTEHDIRLPIEFICHIAHNCCGLDLPYKINDLINTQNVYTDLVLNHPFVNDINKVFANSVVIGKTSDSSIKDIVLDELVKVFGDYTRDPSDYCTAFSLDKLVTMCNMTIAKQTSSEHIPNWNPTQFKRFIPAQFINMYLDLKDTLTDCIIPNNIKMLTPLPSLCSFVSDIEKYNILITDGYTNDTYKGKYKYSILKCLYDDIIEVDDKFYKVYNLALPDNDKSFLVPLRDIPDADAKETIVIGKHNAYRAFRRHDTSTLSKGAVFTYIDFLTYYKYLPIPKEFSVDNVYNTIKYYNENSQALSDFINANLPLDELKDYRSKWYNPRKNAVLRKFWNNMNKPREDSIPSNYEIISRENYVKLRSALVINIGKLIYNNEPNLIVDVMKSLELYSNRFDLDTNLLYEMIYNKATSTLRNTYRNKFANEGSMMDIFDTISKLGPQTDYCNSYAIF